MLPEFYKLHSASIIYRSELPTEQMITQYRNLHPEVFVSLLSYDSVGIDEARDLATVLQNSGEQSRLYIVHLSTITPEAQNYLLKPLEELHSNICIVFMCVHTPVFLPTFLSRLISIDTLNFSDKPQGHTRVMDFIQGTISERLVIIEELLSDKERTHQTSQIFLTDLYRTVRNIDPNNTKYSRLLSELSSLLPYTNLRGASHKMILEYIAHTI